MSKSVLYASNSSTQITLATDTIITYNTIVRKLGNSIFLSGGNVNINSPGYYAIDTNLTFTAAAAGIATVSIYKGGTLIPGAVQSNTVAIGDSCAFSIPAIVKQSCCGEDAITVVISDVAGTVTNASIVVEKE